jgi:hypothetical protein
MSYTTIHQATLDEALQARVTAAASKEAWANPDYASTEYGERLRTYPNEALTTFMYVIAIDNEADYSYAVDNGNENPGGDPGVITDAALQSGVQAHWPASAQVPNPTDMHGPTAGTPAAVAAPSDSA